MFPVINLKETGINLRRKTISGKDSEEVIKSFGQSLV